MIFDLYIILMLVVASFEINCLFSEDLIQE